MAIPICLLASSGRSALRARAALAVNEELIGLYWRIGTEILERQQQEGWGGRVIERLATDLRAEFPQMKGFSYTTNSRSSLRSAPASN